jgi:hypothetical protein
MVEHFLTCFMCGFVITPDRVQEPNFVGTSFCSQQCKSECERIEEESLDTLHLYHVPFGPDQGP